MIRFRSLVAGPLGGIGLFLCLCLTLLPRPASAWEIISFETNVNGLPLSRLALEIEFLSAIPINFPEVPVVGTLSVDFDFDATNSGTIRADFAPLGQLQLANVSQPFNTGITFGTAHLVNVGGTFSFGPEVVLNRNFTVDASTPGGLILNQGLLRFDFVYLFGVEVNGTFEVDLSVDPISFLFSDLGSATIVGTADDAELGSQINFNTFSGNAEADWLGTPSSPIHLSGELHFGKINVPEASSLTLSALASLSLLGWAAVRKRSVQLA